MVMDTLQIRLGPGLVEKIDQFVKTGLYSSRSDVIRDAIRRLTINNMIGSTPNIGDSVTEIRELRKKLSQEKIDLDEINLE